MPQKIFFAHLQPLTTFTALTQLEAYTEIPDDYLVVITDIRGSTKAIEAGRYKDVNLLGVASIEAIQQGSGGLSFPYVFGGDGASAAIPSAWQANVAGRLAALQQLAHDNFGLGLRVGFVPYAELKADGFRIFVARLQLVGRQTLALFRGGGLREADARVKADPARYAVSVGSMDPPDLSAVSCRWQAIPARRGQVVALLIEVVGDEQIYRTILDRLEEIFGGQLADANPVHRHGLRYRPLPELLHRETQLTFQRGLGSMIARLRRWTEVVATTLIFRTPIVDIVPMFRRYRDHTPAHADYRKFDDMLRMVLDCTADEYERIQTELELQRATGGIRYGLHTSTHALMTCSLTDLGDGGHIHFIDGADGGYALAAKAMKAQRLSG